MRIVFSKDRPAQLDLLLRSLQRYAPEEWTVVIYATSNPAYAIAYDMLRLEYPPSIDWQKEGHGVTFEDGLRHYLARADDTVTFLCDDNVLYRPIDETPATLLRELPEVLTFSLRLGQLELYWDWTILPPHDHGYPGSIDGHVFRTTDIQRMIEGQTIDNPLILETVLNQRCQMLAEERPLMASYRQQCLVGIDVNSVAEQGGRPHGKVYPQSAAELNERFLRGERISLDALDLEDVRECLVERQFVWEPAT